MSRRLPAIAAAAVVVGALVALAFVLARRGDGGRVVARDDPRAEALAYAPRGAPVVFGVDTSAPAAGLVLGLLVPRVTGGALGPNDVSPLLGNEAVVALLDTRARRAQLSMVARDPDALRALVRRLRDTGTRYRGARLYVGPRGSAVAVRHDTVIAASDEPTVRRALDASADPRGHLTRAEFDRRLAGLPAAAPVRAIFDPRRTVVAPRLPGLLRTRWGRALRNGAAVLASSDGPLRLLFRLQTEPAAVADADLPFGTGPRPPVMRGRAPMLLGVRPTARFVAFLRRADPGRLGALDRLQTALPAFLRVDVDGLVGGLTGDGTIASADMLDHFTARTDPRDPQAWRRPLQRLSTLSSVLQGLGIKDVELDEERGDAYRLRVDGRLVARAGIFERTLVATDDQRADLAAAAAAPAAPTPSGAAGGLTLRVQPSAVRDLLAGAFGLPPGAALVLDRLGELTGWARAERDGVRGELRLGLR